MRTFDGVAIAGLVIAPLMFGAPTLAEPSAKRPSVTVCDLKANFGELRDRPIVLRAVYVAALEHGSFLVDNRCKGAYLNMHSSSESEDGSVRAFHQEMYGNMRTAGSIYLVKFEGTVSEDKYPSEWATNQAVGTFTIRKVVTASSHRGDLSSAVVPSD